MWTGLSVVVSACLYRLNLASYSYSHQQRFMRGLSKKQKEQRRKKRRSGSTVKPRLDGRQLTKKASPECVAKRLQRASERLEQFGKETCRIGIIVKTHLLRCADVQTLVRVFLLLHAAGMMVSEIVLLCLAVHQWRCPELARKVVDKALTDTSQCARSILSSILPEVPDTDARYWSMPSAIHFRASVSVWVKSDEIWMRLRDVSEKIAFWLSKRTKCSCSVLVASLSDGIDYIDKYSAFDILRHFEKCAFLLGAPCLQRSEECMNTMKEKIGTLSAIMPLVKAKAILRQSVGKPLSMSITNGDAGVLYCSLFGALLSLGVFKANMFNDEKALRSALAADKARNVLASLRRMQPISEFDRIKSNGPRTAEREETEKHLPLQLLGAAWYKKIDFFMPIYSKDPINLICCLRKELNALDEAPAY